MALEMKMKWLRQGKVVKGRKWGRGEEGEERESKMKKRLNEAKAVWPWRIKAVLCCNFTLFFMSCVWDERYSAATVLCLLFCEARVNGVNEMVGKGNMKYKKIEHSRFTIFESSMREKKLDGFRVHINWKEKRPDSYCCMVPELQADVVWHRKANEALLRHFAHSLRLKAGMNASNQKPKIIWDLCVKSVAKPWFSKCNGNLCVFSVKWAFWPFGPTMNGMLCVNKNKPISRWFGLKCAAIESFSKI